MAPDSRRSPSRAERATVVLAVLCVAIFAGGMFIGYHSVYRNIAVAAVHAPAAPL